MADLAVLTFDAALAPFHRALFNQAVEQAREYNVQWGDPFLSIANYDDFLLVLEEIIGSAPGLYQANIDGVVIGEPVGVPLYLVVDLISNTPAGHTLFTDNVFNNALDALLNNWGEWLTTPASAATLGDGQGQWFSPLGLAILEAPLGGIPFDVTFAANLPAPQRYTSWDNFFTRNFLDIGIRRPIIPAPDGVSFLYNPSESTTLRTIHNVQLNDTFWLKTQDYSLFDIFGRNQIPILAEWAHHFVGASASQAFLSPADYHRWHSPIAGNVVASAVIPGSFYAVLPDKGAPEYDPDLEPGDPHGAIIRSQPWLSTVATRAVFIIVPDDPRVALVALIQIGMVEVSSCDVTHPEGDVDAGGPLGTFHFGGSSFLLLVQPYPGFRVIFQDNFNRPIRPTQHRWVRSVIGRVVVV